MFFCYQTKGFELIRFNPTRGSELGGTEVQVILKGFYTTEFPVICRFGDDVEVISRAVSRNKFVCITPPHRPGLLSFSVVQNGVKIKLVEKISSNFEFTILASIFSISPSSGSSANTIYVIGNGFQNTNYLLCRFGDKRVNAHFISNSSLTCKVPIVDPSRPTLFTVSNNGVDTEGDWAGLTFNYTEAPFVSFINPITAPNTGGTNIFIRGGNFLKEKREAICKIGHVLITSIILSDHEMVCPTPKIPLNVSEFFHVQVSVNGGFEFSASIYSRLLLHLPTSIEYVNPISSLGSLVTISGSHFYRNAYLSCVFDNTYTPAIWVSRSLLKCKVPSIKRSKVQLGISTNGQETGLTNTVPFFFIHPITLSSISPTEGVLNGGMTINVRGAGFEDLPVFVCRFGEDIVHATVVFNSSAANCIAPPSLTSILVTFQVSNNNGKNFSSSMLTFKYINPVFINDIFPRMGHLSGNNKLRIYGNFTQPDIGYSSSILCSFYFTDRGSVTSPILAITDGMVSCLTPSLLLHTSPLLFASVGISTSQGTSILYGKKAQFTFYQNVSMKSLSPSLGSEFGGTQVKIYGYFPRSKDISCAFDGIRSLGQWISTDVIICESPAAKGTFLYSPIVPVTIALNGQDEESMSLPFQYMLGAHVSSVIPSFGMVSDYLKIKGIRGEIDLIIDYISQFLC